MKLWISGEIDVEVADAYRATRQLVEKAINARLAEYGGAVNEWAFIGIIRQAGLGAGYPEIKRFDTKDRSLEFRLAIDLEAFKSSSDIRRASLLLESLLRSLSIARELTIPGLDIERLEQDVRAVAVENGWLPAAA
jgi:hypothetical protein